MSAHGLVVAKAPVAGLVKTRLAARVGAEVAADLAAAALLDTLAACAAAFGPWCHLALAGDLGAAHRSEEIRAALRGWHVFAQLGADLGERLAHAHRTVAERTGAGVVQVGMDTPQVRPAALVAAAAGVGPGRGVIGPAVDGGWWLLGLGEPGAADALSGVPMSTGRTGHDTRQALARRGVRLATARTLRDVDTAADAAVVARQAPASRFAEAWSRIDEDVAS